MILATKTYNVLPPVWSGTNHTHGRVYMQKKVIGPVRGCAPGLLHVDQTQKMLGFLSWRLDGRFPVL